MKKRNTFTKLIGLTMALTVMVAIGSIWTPERAGATSQTAAESNTEILIKVLDGPPIGIVPDQTLRFCVANLSTTEEGNGPVRAQAYVYDSRGNLVSQSDPVEVPHGQFSNFDFTRDDLAAAGEPGTGRVQVRARFIYRGSSSEQISPDNLLTSMEIFDNRTGRTTGYQTGYIGWIKISPDL
jgi:hypothetical protein